MVDSYTVAEVAIQGVTLRPVLGAYELVFGLRLNVNAHADRVLRASLIGARVSARSDKGCCQALGFARPETSLEVTTSRFSSPMTSCLVLPMPPGQLAALEEYRGVADLDFELQVEGVGFGANGRQTMQDTWRIRIPRSDWAEKLREAGARNVLFIEVPLPVTKETDEAPVVPRELLRAEEQFRRGDFLSCVATCRTVIQELGLRKSSNKNWAGPALDQLASARNGMTKGEREDALWAALRHYTHQSHHAEGEGGVSEYSRSEAHFILLLTASIAARAYSLLR